MTEQIITALTREIEHLEHQNQAVMERARNAAANLRSANQRTRKLRGGKLLLGYLLAPATAGASLVVGVGLAARDSGRIERNAVAISNSEHERARIENQLRAHRERKALLEQRLQVLRAQEGELRRQIRWLETRQRPVMSENPSIEGAAETVHVSRDLLGNLQEQSGHLTTIRDSAAAVGISINDYVQQLEADVQGARQRLSASEREFLAVVRIAASANPAAASVALLRSELVSRVASAMRTAGLGEPFAREVANVLVNGMPTSADAVRSALIRQLTQELMRLVSDEAAPRP